MTTDSRESSRAKRLKALTHDVHEGVDRSIMSAASFSSLERYAEFLAVQYLFHRDVAMLYDDEQLQVLIPDLARRQRLPLAAADLADLALARPPEGAPAFEADPPAAPGTAP